MAVSFSLDQLNKGCVLEIQPNEDSSDEYFDDEIFNHYKSDLKNLGERQKFKDGSMSFDDIKKNMKPISDDQLVFKEDIKHGIGVIVPEDSLISLHYEAYVEGRSEPFDSTRIREKPYKFMLGRGNLLPGLELGIRTMRKGEHARFLVDSSYAFGPMGCPPRIPGDATILYEVEIINFIPAKDAIEFEDMTPEDQKKAPFEKITSIYLCENSIANDLFRKRAYKPSIARYKKVVRMLEDVSVKDEAEDDKRKEYLLKLYLNLAQANLSMENPIKAIIYADLALKLDPNNVKGLYRMGCALFRTEEYDRAEYYLNRAKQHKPYEKAINDVIVKLQRKRKLYDDWSRKFSQNAFGFKPKGNLQRSKSMEEFHKYISEEIAVFMESDETEMEFSPGYTEKQLDVVKEITQENKLAFVSKIMLGRKINKVAKKKCA